MFSNISKEMDTTCSVYNTYTDSPFISPSVLPKFRTK